MKKQKNLLKDADAAGVVFYLLGLNTRVGSRGRSRGRSRGELCGDPLRLLQGEGVCWGEDGAAHFLFVAPS